MRTEMYVVSGWDVSDPAYKKPAVFEDYTLLSLEDITGQPVEEIPTDPNVSVFHVMCTPAVAAAIKADPDYLVVAEQEHGDGFV